MHNNLQIILNIVSTVWEGGSYNVIVRNMFFEFSTVDIDELLHKVAHTLWIVRSENITFCILFVLVPQLCETNRLVHQLRQI